mgnify:CR=1 FL=1
MSEVKDVLQQEVVKSQCQVDSFYLVKCEWPELPNQIRTPEDVLYFMEDFIPKARSCYVRHNGLVEVYTSGR